MQDTFYNQGPWCPNRIPLGDEAQRRCSSDVMCVQTTWVLLKRQIQIQCLVLRLCISKSVPDDTEAPVQQPHSGHETQATGLWATFSRQIISVGESSARDHSDLKAKEELDLHQALQGTEAFPSMEMQSNLVSSLSLSFWSEPQITCPRDSNVLQLWVK